MFFNEVCLFVFVCKASKYMLLFLLTLHPSPCIRQFMLRHLILWTPCWHCSIGKYWQNFISCQLHYRIFECKLNSFFLYIENKYFNNSWLIGMSLKIRYNHNYIIDWGFHNTFIQQFIHILSFSLKFRKFGFTSLSCVIDTFLLL